MGERCEEIGRDALEDELSLLRESLQQAREAMAGGEDDMLKAGMLVARLGDVVVRATLACDRLARSTERQGSAEAEFDALLRAGGFGEC